MRVRREEMTQTTTKAPETKALTPQQKQLQTVRGMLDGMKGQIQAALPAHMNADRVLRIAMTACQKNPTLLECTPISLAGGVVIASQLGLEIDDGTGQCYLIPFRNNKKPGNPLEATFVPGYKGLIKLAKNPGDVEDIYTGIVYENDSYEYTSGSEEKLTHKPLLVGDRGKAILWYAVAVYRSGYRKIKVITKSDVDKARNFSKAKNASAWTESYDEMGAKTSIIRLVKTMTLSAEKANAMLHKAADLAERAEAGKAQDLDMVIDVTAVGTPSGDSNDEKVAAGEATSATPDVSLGKPVQHKEPEPAPREAAPAVNQTEPARVEPKPEPQQNSEMIVSSLEAKMLKAAEALSVRDLNACLDEVRSAHDKKLITDEQSDKLNKRYFFYQEQVAKTKR